MIKLFPSGIDLISKILSHITALARSNTTKSVPPANIVVPGFSFK